MARVWGWNKPEPRPSTHDNEGLDYHQEWVMNADATRTTTWTSCTCRLGRDHDGAVPAPRYKPVEDQD